MANAAAGGVGFGAGKFCAASFQKETLTGVLQVPLLVVELWTLSSEPVHISVFSSTSYGVRISDCIDNAIDLRRMNIYSP